MGAVTPRQWLESLRWDRTNEHNPDSFHTYSLFPMKLHDNAPTSNQDVSSFTEKQYTSPASSHDIVEQHVTYMKDVKRKRKGRRKHSRSRNGAQIEVRDNNERDGDQLIEVCDLFDISKASVKTNKRNQITSLSLNSKLKTSFCIQPSTMRNLTHLDLFKNCLDEFPSCICDMSSLKDLQMSENKLKHIPGEISNLKNLVKLSIQSNMIAVLPMSICDIDSLKELYVSNNKLIRLPASIGSLENLTHASFAFNKLSWLPRSMGKLKHIQMISLNNNRIRSVPKSFAKLTCLRWLDMTGNSMVETPAFLNKIKTLRVKV